MRVIDMETWPRRAHFMGFNACANPYFSLCVSLELGEFPQAAKNSGYSFTIAMTYAVTRAANDVPELRQRIRGDMVVEHVMVHPSITLLGDDEAFRFLTVEYSEDYLDFTRRAEAQVASVLQQPLQKDDPSRDELIFLSPMPWMTFTGLVFPGHIHPSKSIPMFAWGKYTQDGGALKIPVGVHVHHAVVDGLHVARFYARLEGYFNEAERILGAP